MIPTVEYIITTSFLGELAFRIMDCHSDIPSVLSGPLFASGARPCDARDFEKS